MNDETQGGDPAEDEDRPVKSVDDPNLPPEGDPEDFDEEPVEEAEFDPNADSDETMDNLEEAEEPNDLSGIDKEFDD